MRQAVQLCRGVAHGSGGESSRHRAPRYDFPDTHFCADGDEEIGSMEAVGHPHPVNPSKKLSKAAKAHGWPVPRSQSRGGNKPGSYLRGIRGMMSITSIAPAGLAVCLMTRDKRQVGNLLMPTWIKKQLNLAE